MRRTVLDGLRGRLWGSVWRWQRTHRRLAWVGCVSVCVGEPSCKLSHPSRCFRNTGGWGPCGPVSPPPHPPPPRDSRHHSHGRPRHNYLATGLVHCGPARHLHHGFFSAVLIPQAAILPGHHSGGPKSVWQVCGGSSVSSRKTFNNPASMEDDKAKPRSLQDSEFLESVLSGVPESEQSDFLDSIGTYLLTRFETTGSMDDLDAAIALEERCLELTSNEHPNHAGRLNNLGIALRFRFERTGSMEDLDRVIEKQEQAVESTPLGHPNHAGMLSNLGSALELRFERTGSVEDIDQAIEKQEQAVETTPVDHPNHAMYLSSLGIALWRRFDRTGSMQDLDRAIEKEEQAVESAPVDHPNHAGMLSNLGSALQLRFERTGSVEDIDRAIEKQKKRLNPPRRVILIMQCISTI